MTRLLAALLVLLPAFALAEDAKKTPPPAAAKTDAPKADAPKPLTGAELNKTLYALGAMVAQRTPVGAGNFTDAELKEIIKGFQDAALKKTLAVKMEEYGPKVDQLLQANQKKAGEEAKKKGEEFLAKAAAEKGAEKLPSGVILTTLKAGTGASPAPTDTVSVNYKGTLIDGTEFDSSYKRGQPAEFPLNGVIKCWTDGVGKMKVGGKSKLVCPSAIAYGEQGHPPTIPGNSTLIFEVELLSIKGK